ncbi:hypothetical protein BD626DRAFT_495691 [Schizophyllum amplum]|uniref:UspA domain-containing protein n=1 Tax=Schizophyllum amplum TaxID=97359 RepID=A0A550CEC8_9AGAR|nr:hypothetical protein BD626DRAFT_495691 [Auriculariopsis ampla]
MMRSALKHSTSRPPSPTTASPSDSPMISRVPLPSSPHADLAALPGSSTATLPATAHSPGSLPNFPTHAVSFGHVSPTHNTPGPGTPHTPIALPSFYTPKVSFDTFENPAASMFSFTLSVKGEGYTRTRSTRVFLCAASADESGRGALEWCLETLAQDGDELIVCRGVEEEVLEKDHDIVREDARGLMMEIQAKSVEFEEGRKLSLILEYVPTRPDSVVVGTRGRRTWTNALGGSSMGVGSVSKYCLSHSPVPVIVVRPERKVRKAVAKRRADPKRGRHFD